ncbi:MAG: hypothetical protein MJ193_04275, partial [Clostridia bacterium]|nr:hypothetical protein [Clostridia bacterium]
IKKDSPLPANRETTLSFTGAKGERETAQLVLYANNEIDAPFTIRFSNFKNGESMISYDNIASYVQLYQNVQSTWSVTSSQNKSWFDSNGPETLDLGWYPDALLPYTTAVAKNENVITNSNGNNQGLFFVLEIPEDAVAGTYSGDVLITIGKEILDLPVSIAVYDFTLPEESKSKITISVSASEIGAMYGNDKSSVEGAYYQEAFEFLADRGISGGRTPGSIWAESQMRSQIATLKKYAVDNRIAAYYLPFNYYACTFSVKYKKKSTSISYTKVENINESIIEIDDREEDGETRIGLKTWFVELVNASTNECNLFKKAIMYSPQADEPNDISGYVQNILNENGIKIAKNYALANCDFTGKEEVRESLEKLAYIVTVDPIQELTNGYYSMSVTAVDDNCGYCGITNGMSIGTLDGYCPLYTNFYKSDMKSKIETLMADDTKTVWWYGC